jgi:mannosylglycoprotein endo-beta-mannosidase
MELDSLEQLEESDGLSPDAMVRKTKIMVELYNIHVDEESYWHQRLHARWLLQGDQNTTYFHKIANGGKRKNTLYSLDDNGILVEGTVDLIKHATTYYKDLFGPAPGNMFKLSSNLWSMEETLSVEDNRDLTRPFSEEEVKNALFAMETNRAPGPDNIPTEFYQHCWVVVKKRYHEPFHKIS